MNYQLHIHTEAEADITEAFNWYEGQRIGLGEELLTEIQAAIHDAVVNPRRFPRLRRTPEVRRALSKRFPYRIFFIIRHDAIVVFRVLHGAQHDREWKQSLLGN